MRIVLYLILGVILAAGFLYAAVRRSPQGTSRLSTALVAASFVYVAFAMASMESTWLLVELGGLALFGITALLGSRRTMLWLALGWALHVVWDVGLHLTWSTTYVPLWYPIACTSFDLTVAAYVLREVRAGSEPKPAGAAV